MIERHAGAILILLLLVWGGAGVWFHQSNRAMEKDLQEKTVLMNRYNALKKRWSSEARRKSFEAYLTSLKLRRIDYRLEKSGTLVRLKMTLKASQADTALNRLFQLPLDFGRITLTRKENRLEATVEIKR